MWYRRRYSGVDGPKAWIGFFGGLGLLALVVYIFIKVFGDNEGLVLIVSLPVWVILMYGLIKLLKL